MDSVEPMYSMEEIRSIAKYIFGDDIKIRYTKDEDFEENSGWGYYEDGELVITRGTPASMPMYNAVQKVTKRAIEIAREVFQ